MWLVIAALITGLIVVRSGLEFSRTRLLSNPILTAQLDRQMRLLGLARQILWFFVLLLFACGAAAMLGAYQSRQKTLEASREAVWPQFSPDKVWEAPDLLLAETDGEAADIAYGRDLIAHTQDYYGAEGLVRPNSINALNCQSCHLDAGSRPFGNNYFAVQGTYPQIRARSGAQETIAKRVNDCFQRSLNGQPIDTTSREMRSIQAYIRWLCTGVPKGVKPKGNGLTEVPFLDRPADPEKGRIVFAEKCASCHGADGQGLPIPPDGARSYPPLWGERSFNEAAGLFRLSRLAGYVKSNMPFGATYNNPQLTDEEAWDVAAFVSAQPRPKHPFLATDWPDIGKKPFDHPFGPYKDTFPEIQHKYGPFAPIKAFYKK